MRRAAAFFSVLSGLYTVRMIWNHGHGREAVALVVAGVALIAYEAFEP